MSSNRTGGPAGPAAAARGVVEGLGLARPQVALAHEPLDRLLQELVEGLLVGHQTLELVRREQAPAQQGLEDRVVQGLQVVPAPVLHLAAEAALQEEVGELVHELVEVEVVPELADVAVVADDGH